MSTFEYVGLPSCATRLQGKAGTSPAKQVVTPLPKISDSPSTKTTGLPASPTSSTTSFTAASLTSPTNAAFSMLPQLLFSAAIPNTPTDAPRNRRGSVSMEQRPLLSARDPLSLPITSNNFKRFVARAGPVFWMQDRIEEVITWKKGNCVTAAWLAGYAFLCYFPKMVFFLPHAALIGIILSTYQYPTIPGVKDAQFSSTNSKSSNGSESSSGDLRSNFVDWQANLQGIQNLMGVVSDTYDLLQPHAHHLVLSPAHLSRTPQGTTPSPPPSPYPPYILLTLLLTAPPFVLILSSSLFPARLVTFLVGALPILALHPAIGPLLLHFFEMSKRAYECLSGYREVAEDDKEVMVLLQLAQDAMMMAFVAKRRILLHLQQLNVFLLACRRFLAKFGLRFASTTVSNVSVEADDEEINRLALLPVQSLLERVVDNDRLDDRIWRSELREVEIWENERFQPAVVPRDDFRKRSSSILSPRLSYFPDGELDGNEIPLSDKNSALGLSDGSTLSEDLEELGPGTWSKNYLRPIERKPWTRGRDGWGGIRPRLRSMEKSDKDAKNSDKKKEDDEAKDRNDGSMGYVSSNLTFSLSPGWAFIPTEGWRKDRVAEWSGDASYTDLADTSGWVYTNDAWGGPLRKHPVKGSVTRRRRWTRRVWFDGQDATNAKQFHRS